MTKPRPVPVLPAQGRRIAFVGKGGAGKSTMLAHFLAYWKSYGVPSIGIDTDVPGEDENGTLYEHAQVVDLGAPVYPAPGIHQIRNEAVRLCPEKGLCALDTGAWERKKDGPHLPVLSAVDLAVLCLQPTGNEVQRAGSVLGAIESLSATGAHAPELVILLTMVDPSTATPDDVDTELAEAGYTVLRNRYELSNARNGYAQSWGKPINTKPDTNMDRMAREILDVVAR
ncbi:MULTISPECIES: ATP-binding protein [Streptomyces]|uniref:ATP-binding protein n=1 Tax=Streptomyces TaxID=1883 RepID=UPI0033D37FC0